jgi:hypothetical protein
MIHKETKSQRRKSTKLDISLDCKMCGVIVKSNAGLASHLRWEHDESYESYILRCYNIDIIKLEEEYQSYRINNKEKINKEITRGLRKHAESLKGKTKKEILGEDRYQKFRESMKGVFSLEWFIKKYGEEEGRIKYQERSVNVSKKSHFKIYNQTNKNNWSNISQELFQKIYDIIGNKFNNIYFAKLNHEYSCGIQSHNFDFVVLDNKKVIEFHGDRFHANPELYKEDDIPLKFLNKTSKEIWNEDREKYDKIKNKGFELKVVWEKDYLKNKNETVLDCIKFLLS